MVSSVIARLFLSVPIWQRSPEASLSTARCARRYKIRHWDSDPVISWPPALITACYRRHIDAEINDQYRTHAGSIRFLNNIVRFPGCGQSSTAHSSFSAVHRPTQRPGRTDPLLRA